MRQIIILLAFLLSSYGFSAQTENLKNVSETQKISKRVANLFKENKITLAFNELKPYWPLPSNELESLEEKTIKYINIIESRFGKSINFLKVKNETISDIAIRETYIIQYTNSAIRLIFTYYKNNKGWIINAFKWDDSFEEEFK
ncbi:hypothetical protein [Polaribacter aquimarinus]|uniref:DUF4440 domain-containing protein n=1 Tax=Polaribacter aquimarinus TaxID=2100726 RepID=A0A2U2JD34_9FLAO|nr:hypothetical protein [Polaribacter aquimarinus]PWG06247.1 hypothetical protein DIS07_06880 [Polaribacter aquimarinus]